MIDYVQLLVGLVAIGRVFVEALIIAYGEGKNGKSTFWNTIARVLGTYSGNLSAEVLTVNNRSNVQPELAELRGKRLVIAAELEESQRLNTARVKHLCSTDAIFAAAKYRQPFAFTPTHSAVLYTNNLPRVGAIDAGTWRRLLLLPFNATISASADIKNFADYLFENAGGAVLQWIIDGAQRVIASNFQLVQPAVVQNAIRNYRDTNDWLTAFIEEKCEVDTTFTEASSIFYTNYRNHCGEIGEYAHNKADFYAALDAAGFKRRKTNHGSIIKGLRLRNSFYSGAPGDDGAA